MKFLTFLCMASLTLACANSHGKKRAHPLSYIQIVVTEIIPVKKLKILTPQACNKKLGSWRRPELDGKLSKLKRNKKCWVSSSSKLSLNLDSSFWIPSKGNIQAVIFEDDRPVIVQVNDEFSFLGEDEKLQFGEGKKEKVFSPKTTIKVTSDYIHPCFSQKGDLDPTNEPNDMVFWYKECLKSTSPAASSSQFLGFGLVKNQSLRILDKILDSYWREKSLSKTEAIKQLKEEGLTQFEYLLEKFDSHSGRGLRKSCFEEKPIEEFSANVQTLGGEFQVKGKIHICPYIELRFE